MAGFLMMMLVLFVLFLVPFDRRFIERFIMPLGGKRVGSSSLSAAAPDGQLTMGAGLTETSVPGGPYTRQLCNMLDLEVVVLRDLSSFHVGSCFVQLAIGRWNEEAWEFETVTEWCQTWEDLEEDARRAVKSFREVANSNYRGASTV
jgi:hypothetical protein